MVEPDFRAISSGQLSWESLSLINITSFRGARQAKFSSFSQAGTALNTRENLRDKKAGAAFSPRPFQEAK
jgi:hypothetical protein